MSNYTYDAERERWCEMTLKVHIFKAYHHICTFCGVISVFVYMCVCYVYVCLCTCVCVMCMCVCVHVCALCVCVFVYMCVCYVYVCLFDHNTEHTPMVT